MGGQLKKPTKPRTPAKPKEPNLKYEIKNQLTFKTAEKSPAQLELHSKKLKHLINLHPNAIISFHTRGYSYDQKVIVTFSEQNEEMNRKALIAYQKATSEYRQKYREYQEKMINYHETMLEYEFQQSQILLDTLEK